MGIKIRVRTPQEVALMEKVKRQADQINQLTKAVGRKNTERRAVQNYILSSYIENGIKIYRFAIGEKIGERFIKVSKSIGYEHPSELLAKILSEYLDKDSTT